MGKSLWRGGCTMGKCALLENVISKKSADKKQHDVIKDLPIIEDCKIIDDESINNNDQTKRYTINGLKK
ncbi:hypothetical protein [Nitrosopumilus ureiphilus]|nr:hypothetical protein [Nitrosopumilus ureiphilus]